ncbi:MAG: DUF4173 domain-containing protein [Oscillospiraceae bacterium]|nr:DUF4173 domain-containing protein [Oscillospiraceae bacterium]
MDENIGVPVRDSETLTRLRENGGKLLLTAAIVGAARPLCFCRADSAGINVTVFTAILFICIRAALRLSGAYDAKKFLLSAAAAAPLAFSAAWTMNSFVQTVSRLGVFAVAVKLIADSFADNAGLQFGGYLKAFSGLVIRALKRIGEPVTRLLSLIRLEKLKYVLAGVVIALPLAAIAVSLLLSADWVFKRMFTVELNIGEAGKIAAAAIWGFIWCFFAFYCVFAGQAEGPAAIEKKEPRRANAAVAVTFMGILGVIYLVFCAVQVIFLFGRHALPEGQTYSGYAREGFFQLLFVCAMNELLIMLCTRKFRLSGALKAVLTVICGCTYIMIASSACRMIMYVQAYGMTFLRILVLWFLLVLTVVLSGSLIYVFKSFDLFRFCCGVSLAMWLVFAYARPDELAARYNAAELGMTRGTAENMMWELSEDAAVVLARNVDAICSDVLRAEAEEKLEAVLRHARYRDFRSFNLSMLRARKAIELSAAGRGAE